MKTLRAGVPLVALVVGLSCGIPRDSRPNVLPGGAIAPALGSTAPAATVPPVGVDVTVFFVRADQIAPVRRTAERGDVNAALQNLLTGPSEQEMAAGFRTAITSPAVVRLLHTEGGTAHVDLAAPFVEIGGPEQILALAQVVLTATAVPGIASVRFSLDGQAVDVPRGDGTLSPGPLAAAAYAPLRAPSG